MSKHNPYRRIIMPPEHGSWGFVLEPILLGLAVAPTRAGALLTVGTLGAFLMRWPFKVWLTSRAQRRARRAQMAGRVVAGFGLLAAFGFVGAILLGGWRPLWPLVAALPFGIVFAAHDLDNDSRSWRAELSGTAAFALVAPALALAGDWSLGLAFALWPLLLLRSWPSIAYVRERIKLEKGRAFRPKPILLLHLLALLTAAAITAITPFSPLMVLIYLALLLRAAWGLSPYRRSRAIKAVGISELIWGALLVTTLAIGV